MASRLENLYTSLIKRKDTYSLDGLSAHQPEFSVLQSERGQLLLTLEKALEAYLNQIREESTVVKQLMLN